MNDDGASLPALWYTLTRCRQQELRDEAARYARARLARGRS